MKNKFITYPNCNVVNLEEVACIYTSDFSLQHYRVVWRLKDSTDCNWNFSTEEERNRVYNFLRNKFATNIQYEMMEQQDTNILDLLDEK